MNFIRPRIAIECLTSHKHVTSFLLSGKMTRSDLMMALQRPTVAEHTYPAMININNNNNPTDKKTNNQIRGN